MRAYCISLFLVTLCYTLAGAQSYRLFTMRDGLSQMKITSLHLDKRGYLWIGTRNGLNKFDGEKLRSISKMRAYCKIGCMTLTKTGWLFFSFLLIMYY